MKTAFVFPGQGAQFVSMGKDFYDTYPVCKETFDTVNRVLERDLTKIVFEGPEDSLNQTENTQSAMLATCTAIARLLAENGVSFTHTAGLSLGEYSALVASGAISYEDALVLVEARARYMQEAVPEGLGGMVAVLGLDEAAVTEAVAAGERIGPVSIANYNAPGQIVMTGMKEALLAASDAAKALGAKKCVPLAVSAPFHSELLADARERLGERLAKVSFLPLEKRVYANVTAKPVESEAKLPQLLAAQVTSSILWQQSVEAMLDEGVTRFIEIGPGKTLTGFIKRIAKQKGVEVELHNIQTAEDFQTQIDTLRGDTR